MVKINQIYKFLKPYISKILFFAIFIFTSLLAPLWIWLIWKKLKWSKTLKWVATSTVGVVLILFISLIIATQGTPTFDKINTPTNQTPVTLSAQDAYKNSEITLFQNDLVIKELKTDDHGRFSINVDLKEGDNRFTATVTNEKGKQKKSQEYNIVYDKTPPVIVLASQDKIEINDSNTEVKGTTEKKSEVTLSTTEKVIGKTTTNDGNFTFKVKELKSGDNNLIIEVKDEAGNLSDKKDITVKYTPKVQEINTSDLVEITRVIDGDTIEVSGVGKIRLIGMDTPETLDPRKVVQCFGSEASVKAKEMLQGKKVRLESDASQGDKDKYDRALRYIYLEDGTSFNKWMIENGFAHEYTYTIPYKYQQQYKDAEKNARENNRGFWSVSSCNGDTEKAQTKTAAPTTTPSTNSNSSNSSQTTQPSTVSSSSQKQTPSVPTSDQCLIKGNISTSTKEKIYHMPGGAYYNSTVIDEGRGERWFCKEADAQAAGWRRSSR